MYMATKKTQAKKAPQEKKECLSCLKEKNKSSEFYMSNSEYHADGRYPICKTCIKKRLKLEDPYSKEAIDSIKDVLLEMNRPYLHAQYLSSIEESKNTGRELFGMYLKSVIFNFKEYTWKDSEFENSNVTEKTPQSNSNDNEIKPHTENTEDTLTDNRDKEDVIRMIGYDPFEYESSEDRKYLYSKLVDFLDESTLDDGFKLQAVIEIVKGFNQIDKINQAITTITKDINRLTDKSGGIKGLIDSKKNILASLIKLAEDNGISVKHNNQKSKGAGTLSGIIKALQEKGIEEGEMNLFDIETAQGMKQVADMSNQSIIAQLQFDENDYTSMIIEQRELISELDSKVIKLEEENRLLKKELLKYKKSN